MRGRRKYRRKTAIDSLTPKIGPNGADAGDPNVPIAGTHCISTNRDKLLPVRTEKHLVVYIPWTKASEHQIIPPPCARIRSQQLSVEVLREQRTAAGVSQEALALSADVDRTFVSQIERGIRQPTLTTLCKLARALDVQPSTLVSRMEKLLR